MSGRLSSSPSRWPSESSGRNGSSGATLRWALKLILRFADFGAAVYWLWLPLQPGFDRLLAAASESLFTAIGHPPLITALETRGNIFHLHSFISGRNEVIATWDAESIHIYLVATLALA